MTTQAVALPPRDHHRIDIALVMATRLEALPLLEREGVTQLFQAPFPTYANDTGILVISGIGKAHAAAATTWLICEFAPARVINAGAAGSTTCQLQLGDIFQIRTIYELDRPRLRCAGCTSFELPIDGHLPVASLATQDHPVKEDAEREQVAECADLVDMEGAAVAQTCQLFQTPLHLIKFVSDTHGAHDIRTNILKLRHPFCDALDTCLASLGHTTTAS